MSEIPPKPVKNCFSCALAKDMGNKFKCRWTPKRMLEYFPFYPVFLVNVHTAPVSKEKIPERDCPAFKAKKEAVKPKGDPG